MRWPWIPAIACVIAIALYIARFSQSAIVAQIQTLDRAIHNFKTTAADGATDEYYAEQTARIAKRNDLWSRLDNAHRAAYTVTF